MQDNIVKKILFLLGDDKRKIFFIVFLSLISSFIDIIGLGLIGPYASFVINPETFNLKDTFFNFSFFKDKNYDYIIIMFSIILILVFIAVTTNDYVEKFIYSVIVGGALGNFYDRLILNAVPDFIDIHYNNFHWFIFNVADIFITLGIICFIIKGFFLNNKNEII